jgi:hypothetical protein
VSVRTSGLVSRIDQTSGIHQQEQRHRGERAKAPRQRAEGGHQRQEVAVEVSVEWDEGGEVGQHEGGEHPVGEGAIHEGENEAGEGDQERGADALPEAVEEGDRRPRVVFEAERAATGLAKNTSDIAERVAEVDGEIRAGGEERGRRERSGDGEAAPVSPPCHEERDEQDEPRILEAGGQPDRNPRRDQLAADEERQ